MFKVLLADDNYIVLEHFSKMIKWEEYGFEVVSTVMDGKKALSDFERFNPELVITDIQMPKMTGIELAENINRLNPNTVVIFLTSYEEFSYIKSGVDLGICGYLLKHETTPERLVEILQKAKKSIQSKKLQSQYSSAPLYALIRDLSDDNVEEKALYEYEISFPEKYDMILLEQDRINPVISELLKIKTKPVYEKELIRFCNDTFNNIVAIISIDEYKFLILIKSGTSITELSYEIQNKLFKKFHTTFFELIVADNAPILTCAEKYSYSIKNIDQRIFYPRSSIAHSEYMRRPQSSEINIDFATIDKMIKEYQFDRISVLMEQYFSDVLDKRDYNGFNNLIKHFITILLSYDNKVVDFQTGLPFHVTDENSEKNWYDANSSYQWLKYKFAELSRFLSHTNYFRYSNTVRQAIEYINKNYANSDLSVDLISDSLKIHPNQLNIIFKKETGETVWKFIIKVRMDKAKKLLSIGNERVTDICSAVGYKNISYFSKVFKITYGMTPLEYRRMSYEI